VIDDGKRTIAMPAGDPWQALLELFDLGLLVSRANYLAFVAASLMGSRASRLTDPKQAN
jgi:hypothetical protein